MILKSNNIEGDNAIHSMKSFENKMINTRNLFSEFIRNNGYCNE